MVILSNLFRLAGRFRRDRNGAVAVIFALLALPLIGLAGSAIDYTYASKVKAKLDAAADAAALAAVKISATMPTTVLARQNALSAFGANTGNLTGVTFTALDAAITDTGTVRSAVVTYTAVIPTAFMSIFGYATTTIVGKAQASATLPPYIDFHIMLDNTPSMGVGATPSDIAVMVANTSDKCGFACHITGSTNDYYALAKKLGVTMRIDVVRQATQQLMDTAVATQRIASQFRAAIYTFGDSCTQIGFTTITPLTSSLSSAKTAANKIDLMTIPWQGYNNDQCTDNTAMLNAVNLAIATPGDGTTAAAPQKVLFFVSDGVTDAYYPSTCTRSTTSGRCQEPLNPAVCETIKSRGIRIAVLYTTYNPLPTNDWYNSWIKPFQSTIGTKMMSCASPGLYFEVSPTQGIAEAMNALFQRAVATARLTQ